MKPLDPGQIADRSFRRDGNVIDLAAVGAEPGDDGAMATCEALENAVAACADPSAPPGRKVIRLPAGTFCLPRPVFLNADTTRIEGAGISRTFLRAGFTERHHLLMVGIPRDPGGKTLPADAAVPLDGLLDATAGRRWGLDLSGTTRLCQWTGPLNLGPSGRDSLTIEVALKGVEPKVQVIAGCSRYGVPAPFVVTSQRDGQGTWVLSCHYRTSDGLTRECQVPVPQDGGLHRYRWQFDVKAGRVSAYVDGLQSPAWEGFTPVPFPPGVTLGDNPNLPFKTRSCGPKGPDPGTDFWDIDPSSGFVLAALRLSSAPRFAAGSPGDPLRRLDGRPVTDADLFACDPDTIAVLPMTDTPADLAGRCVKVLTPACSTVAFLLDDAHRTWGFGGIELADLDISHYNWTVPGAAYGDAVCLGSSLEFSADRCRISGAGHGLGSWSGEANYVTRLDRCVLGGGDAALFNFYGIAELTRSQVERHGRATIWSFLGDLTIRDTFMSYVGPPAGSPCEAIVRNLGGVVDLDNVRVDIEDAGYGYPSVAALDATADTQGGNSYGAVLVARRFALGTCPSGVPLVRLRTNAGAPPGIVRLTDPELMRDTTGTSPLIDADDQWVGRLDTFVPWRGPRFARPGKILDSQA